MSSWNCRTSFRVSIFKPKNLQSPWSDFADFLVMIDETLIFCLNYRNPSEPLTVFEISVFEICLSFFSCDKFGVSYIGLIFPIFLVF